MLYYISEQFGHLYGPLRLLQSYTVLIGLALFAGFFVTLFLMPKFYPFLPKDRGREFTINPEAAMGKPTSSGLIFVSIFCLMVFIFIIPSMTQILIIVLTWCVMLTGYFDDKSNKPWGEYLKGALDFILSVCTSIVLFYVHFEGKISYWLPITSKIVSVYPLIFFIVSTVILWISINTTNCTDGIDGLSGTLILIALFSLGGIFYFIFGHVKVSSYLLVPYIADGAKWGVIIFLLAGVLMGYLWHNAFPSKALMGDSGSRALGFFVGVLVLISANPFLLFMTSGMILINGGTGLFKVSLLRFFHIRIFRNIRFPLHDHMRKKLQWSPTQVLLRFIIIQILITGFVFGILFKIR